MPIITLGEERKKGSISKDAVPTTNEEIQNYVNNMCDNEKKEFIFFLVHKVTEEKNKLLSELSNFNTAIKDLVIANEIANFSQLEAMYDDVIIPMIRGVYVTDNPFEAIEMKLLKKKIMSKLTIAFLGEYIKSKK